MGGIIAFAFFCPFCLWLITERKSKRKIISNRKAGMSLRYFARQNKLEKRTSMLPNSRRTYCYTSNILNTMELYK
jgi:hypothetical protein